MDQNKKQLVDYLRTQLKLGVPAATLATTLKAQGWTDQDVNEAILIAGSSVSDSGPIPPATTASVNSVTTMNSTSPVGVKPKHNIVKQILVIVILLIVCAGISYGSYWGYNLYQANQITLGKVFTAMVNHVKNGDVKSAEIASGLDVTLTGNDAITSGQYAQVISGINTIKTNIAFDGIFDNTVKDNFKTYGKLDITLNIDAKAGSSYGALTSGGPMVIEVEYYAFPDSIYFKLNKVPAFVGAYTGMIGIDISPYINQWIMADQKVVDAFGSGFARGSQGSFSVTKLTDEENAKLQSAVVEFLDKSGAFTITDKKSETTAEGTAVTALHISFNNDKFLTGIVKLARDMKVIFPDKMTTVDPEKTLSDADFVKSIKDISITDFTLLVGTDGYIYGSSGTVNVAANDTTPVVVESVNNTIKNYNKEFGLQKPTDAKDINLVIMEIQSAMQKSSVKQSVIIR